MDAIYEKTITPIPTGGIVRGWLKFVFENDVYKELKTAGTKVSLHWTDVTGNPGSAEKITEGKLGNLKYLPGSGGKFTGMK